ncbi:MAG TPA: radical SAM protein, partial [Spirochaetota bacterium]|nr:radical SAM protein [Spirochaetota bacterium]
MLYNEPVFRPPAEAFSLIVQTSIGCPYNKCTFCAMYKNKKYRVLSFSEIEQHIANLKKEMPQAKPLRAFLADGDALAAETKLLLKSVTLLKNYFPTVRRIGSYGSVFSLQRKSISDLKRLAAAGLTFIYLGLESGSGQVLKKVHKYSSPAANISACRKAAKSGIKLSLMIIA